MYPLYIVAEFVINHIKLYIVCFFLIQVYFHNYPVLWSGVLIKWKFLKVCGYLCIMTATVPYLKVGYILRCLGQKCGSV